MEYYRLNELPETYKRYKTFTEGFEKWMMKVGKQRGLEIAEQAEAAAKAAAAKDKKKHGRAKSYNILTKDILPMAEAIAESGIPEEDVSGLADLKDAIRLRKEVNEWYRHMKISDEQHPLFASLLNTVLGVLDPLNKLSGKKPQPKADITFVVFQLGNNFRHPDNAEDEEDAQNENEEAASPPTTELSDAPSSRLKAKPQNTAAEREIEQEFEVLCFLYDLYSLRCRVKDIWNDWIQQKIGTMTAALASDIAMSRVYQRATLLHENLKEDDKKRTIVEIIEKLRKLAPATEGSAFPYGKDELATYPSDLLCHDAIRIMEKFWTMGSKGINKAQHLPPKDSFCLRFLAHFKLILENELRVAAGLPLDKFTESISSPEAQSEAWLPFGFQILLDIQETLTIQMKNAQWDVIDHATRVLESIQEHFTYEDEVWDTEDKPDYMTIGKVKWATTYLHFVRRVIDWVQQSLKDTPEKVSGMTHGYFLAVHPILSGRTMWDYHRTFHSAAISKIQWFVIALAHLYNACRQVGGLEMSWPDLEFIIHCQGIARVYIGGPPTDPNVFHKRLALALCGSSAEYAKDYRGNHQLDPETKSKRGLATYFPLEGKISKYFESTSRSDRSSQLHNLFASLHNERKRAAETSQGEEPKTSSRIPDKARSIFEAIANKRARTTKNKKNRKKNKSRVPDFSNVESVHAELLGDIVSQLTEHEVYSNFDHLSFFRRAITIVNHVRREVLWDDSKALATLDAEQEPPNDFTLLYNLLHSLKTPRDKSQKKQTDKLHDGLEKTKRIADVMRAFIKVQGDAEKNNAEEQTRRRRQHDTLLSAVYSAHVKATPVSFKDLPNGPTNFNARPSYDFGQTATHFGSTASTNDGSQELSDTLDLPRLINPHDRVPFGMRSVGTQTEDEDMVLPHPSFSARSDGRPILVPKGKLGVQNPQNIYENDMQQSFSSPPSWLPILSTEEVDAILSELAESPNNTVYGEKSFVTDSSELILPCSSSEGGFEYAGRRSDPELESEEEMIRETVQGETSGSYQNEVLLDGQEEATAVTQDGTEIYDLEKATSSTSPPVAEAPRVEDPCDEVPGYIIEEVENMVREWKSELMVQISSQIHDAEDIIKQDVHVETPVESGSMTNASSEVQDTQYDSNEEVQEGHPVEDPANSEPITHDLPDVHSDQEDRNEEVRGKNSVARERSWRILMYVLSALASLKQVITGRTPSVPDQDTDDLDSALDDSKELEPAATEGLSSQEERNRDPESVQKEPIIDWSTSIPSSLKYEKPTKRGSEVVGFGVYHRMVYSSRHSTRSRRPANRERSEETLSNRPSLRSPRQHSANVKKRTICHVCHGRCLIGKALLKEDYNAFWNRHAGSKAEGKDGWETDDEDDEDQLELWTVE